MTPITERLAEALREARNDLNETAGSNSQYIAGLDKLLAEYDRLRTHPAERGEGRDYVLVPREPTEAMVSAGFDVHPCRTGETKVTDAYKAMLAAAPPPQPVAPAEGGEGRELTFNAFRAANVARCIKWHPAGIASWSPSDWLTAVTGELGELASLLKMRNRERDGLPGNKFSPTDKQVADELADVLTYLDLLAAVLGVDLGRAAVAKFNEVSERVGFPDRIATPPPQPVAPERGEAKAVADDAEWNRERAALLRRSKESLALEILNMREESPQPPPAPMFRDPTIEDLQAARLFIEQYEREHPEADNDELEIAALNAIGAKVEEKT